MKMRKVSGTEQNRPADLNQALLDGVGGPSGMVYTALPILVFVTANAVVALPITIAAAVVTALASTVWRLRRGERFSAASGGLWGVLLAGGIAAWTGSAGDFFAIGIWASLAGAVAVLVSLLVRRPLTGVVWNAVHGGAYPWREDRPTRRAHDLATFAAAMVLCARFVVMEWLYLSDATGLLGLAKIAMGAPLTVPALLVIVWAFRRSTKRLIRTPSTDGAALDGAAATPSRAA